MGEISMLKSQIDRRRIVGLLPATLLCSLAPVLTRAQGKNSPTVSTSESMNNPNTTVNGEALQAPYTAGTEPPLTSVPYGATDCHHHIFDLRFPEQDGLHPLPASYRTTPPDVSAYQLYKRRLGLTRSIVIAPSNYGDDNSCLIDALQKIGLDKARGVAIVRPEVPDAELDRLHKLGVRGIRIYLTKSRAPTAKELQNLGSRVKSRGWHLQLVGVRTEEVFVDWEPILAKPPCNIVIDHFGYAPQPAGVNSATAGVIRRLLDNGKTYVKLSGVYIQSKVGFPAYSDINELGIELVKLAPERMLWGSDWPHVGAATQKPDGAKLIDQLSILAPNEDVRRKILVENPQRVYWID
jgi:D-galactarolactone isomerase